MRLCEFPGCGKRHSSKGLCMGHYSQLKAGKPLTELNLTMRPAGSPPRIFWDEAPCPNPTLEGPCHLFRFAKTSKGYGQIYMHGKSVLVHRYVWEQAHGSIPEGMVIDHQCRVRSCCNILHLRVVTEAVNLTENVVGSCWQLEAAKTHCPQGHPYDEGNTWFTSKGHRNCRTCNRLKARARRQREMA